MSVGLRDPSIIDPVCNNALPDVKPLGSLARQFFCRAFFRDTVRFANRHPHGQPRLADLWRWNQERRRLGLPMPPVADLTPVQPDFARIYANQPDPQVTWIGHSTLLVQMAGLNILTDPHFSAYASPVPGFGPRRWQNPGVALDDLPPLDLILISHNHYDHLDLWSVRQLVARHPSVQFIVPLGLDGWFRKYVSGGVNVFPLGWDECIRSGNLEIFFVAVQHWSKRTLTDTNTSLWGGFVLLASDARFFFAGDLGFSDACQDIGRQYGPFDLAAIPVGAYEPRWFMHNQHISPEEAVRVHRDVRARRSLGIHWGTFHGITDESLDQPPADLADARRAMGISEQEFFVLRHGETIQITTE